MLRSLRRRVGDLVATSCAKVGGFRCAVWARIYGARIGIELFKYVPWDDNVFSRFTVAAEIQSTPRLLCPMKNGRVRARGGERV